MEHALDFDFFEDRYPKRIRKPINKPEVNDDLEDEILFQKQKLMSHCVYDIQEIVSSSEFTDEDVVRMNSAADFNLEFIHKNGLSTPMLFTVPPEELGMTVPDPDTFTVYDVLELAGKERRIEVVEVNEQKGRTMKLSEFIKYYTCPAEYRTELLNVLSLEFSLTNLANQVKAPLFVSQIDWIDNVWPRELFDRQLVHMKTSDYTDFSTYPKVQRYCLMSVANCFTDFHIDFGGTSVWYHVLKGKKIFWLIEPTEENILLYEEWIMGGNNSESFFGRIVNKCNRVELSPGMTFIIPSGWIHCVFTPEDSLVFGGNFLHSYSIPMQIRIVKSEDRIRVGSKYRFPHFKQMIWYIIEHIVREATGRRYLRPIKVKAYLANQQKSKLNESEEDDEVDSLDDQEPCCSSAVETGCKKSGLIKDTFLTGMGIEDSDSDNDEERVVPSVDDKQNSDICYDDIPNGADGCYMLVPTQMKFSPKNNEKFTPVDHYNEDYLNTVTMCEINGFFSLLEYAKKLLKTKRPDVGEGITRPKHMLLEFEHLINHISKSGMLTLNKDVGFVGMASEPTNYEQSCEFLVPIKQLESVSLTIQESNKKRKVKRKIPVQQPKTEDLKKPSKIGKQARRSTENPNFIDGLPLPTHSNDTFAKAPNPYDFNPLDAVVPLGQKPLPSAYRQSSNMAQIPIMQRFKLKKKEVLEVKVDEEPSSAATTTVDSNPVSHAPVDAFSPTLHSPSANNKPKRKTPSFSEKGFANRMNTEDSTLEYRSPLQRAHPASSSLCQQLQPKAEATAASCVATPAESISPVSSSWRHSDTSFQQQYTPSSSGRVDNDNRWRNNKYNRNDNRRGSNQYDGNRYNRDGDGSGRNGGGDRYNNNYRNDDWQPGRERKRSGGNGYRNNNGNRSYGGYNNGNNNRDRNNRHFGGGDRYNRDNHIGYYNSNNAPTPPMMPAFPMPPIITPWGIMAPPPPQMMFPPGYTGPYPQFPPFAYMAPGAVPPPISTTIAAAAAAPSPPAATVAAEAVSETSQHYQQQQPNTEREGYHHKAETRSGTGYYGHANDIPKASKASENSASSSVKHELKAKNSDDGVKKIPLELRYDDGLGSSDSPSQQGERALDPIQAINAISQLTTMIGGGAGDSAQSASNGHNEVKDDDDEDMEDLDLRDPRFYGGSVTHSAVESGNVSRNSYSPSNDNTSNDPLMAIDEIHRLSQMFS